MNKFVGKSFAIKSSLFKFSNKKKKKKSSLFIKWIQKVSYDFKNVKKIPLIQLDNYYSKKNKSRVKIAI